MLQLIADSGSTKTLWVLVGNNKEILRSETHGINPYLLNKEEITAIIFSELDKTILSASVDKIVFYGAGCSVEERKLEVRNAIKTVFNSAIIEVEHDMLASCRALLGNGNGIACILGTGSNSCLYVDGNIVKNLPSPGYVFGDEGGGVHIGKLLLEAYIYNLLPEDLKIKLETETGVTYSVILENVYKKPMPNRYIASFAKFVGNNMEDDFCKELVKKSFQQFVERHILPYQNSKDYKVSFVGSVAFNFEKQLSEVLNSNELKLDKIIQTPIDGLIAYHVEVS